MKHTNLLSLQTLLRTGCTIAFGLQFCAFIAYGQTRTTHEIDSIRESFVANRFSKRQGGDIRTTLLATSEELLRSNNLKTNLFNVYEVDMASSDKGFVIVSNDKRLPEVIGYSETSAFCKDNVPPAFVYWLSTFAEADGGAAPERMLADVKEEGVAPLLGETQWGQGTPYNNLCPTVGRKRSVTGCVATAMAQIMSMYKYPSRGTGKISYRTETNRLNINEDLADYYFDWNNILPTYASNYTKAQADAVATLMYCCGIAVSMDYDPDGSGAYPTNQLAAYINNFKYDADAAIMLREFCTTDDWHDLMIEELNEGRPIHFGGSNNTDGGHSFVIDGYKSSANEQYPYYHLNWGWDGACDGYYQVANLQPSENGKAYTKKGFNEGQSMMIGVMPDDGIDGGRNILCSTGLNVSSKSIKPGQQLVVSVSAVYNLSLSPFTGNVFPVLVDAEGNETKIGNKTMEGMEYCEGEGKVSITSTIPNNTPEGTYRLELRSILNGHSEATKVFSPSYPSVKIASDGGEQPQEEREVRICASDLDVVASDEDESQMVLRVYILKNVSLKAFMGNVRMAIIDSKGNLVSTFGESVALPELGYKEIVSQPVRLKGYFPDEIENGRYLLGVAAKYDTEDEYTIVGYAETLRGLPIDTSPIGLMLEATNDKIIVNGLVFKRGQANGVDKVCIDNSEIVDIYDVKGQKKNSLSNLPKGVYFVRLSDGSIVKMSI